MGPRHGVFVKKTVHALLKDAEGNTKGLKRTLGAFNLVAMGIGAIVGAGLFVLSGEAAAKYAGPAVAISFFLAAIICFFAALCYAEFAAMVPISGGAYTYTYVTLGEFPAWLIGWLLTVEYLFSASTVAVGWSGYLSSILSDFGLKIPHIINSAPVAYDPALGWIQTGALFNLPAIIIMCLIGYLIAVGVKTAAIFNDVMVVIKMVVIVLFVGFGIAFIQAENLTPFIPENTGIFGQFGWSGILRGTGIAFFAFIGFDAVSTLAQEAKRPKTDMPIGIFGSLGISAVIYVIVAIVLTGVVFYKGLGVADPLAVALNAFGPKFVWLRSTLKIAILVGLTSVILVMTMAQTRVYYTMAHDGLLPKAFGKIHKKFRTPFISTVFVTALGALVCGLFPVIIIGQIVAMGTLLIFGVVSFNVIVMRYLHPKIKRPFKVPLFPIVPAVGVLTCIGQMFLMPLSVWIQLVVWIGLGCLLYLFYGRKNSVLRQAFEEV
jgi:APA family basic amino acid/polyamine antiporter